MKQLYSLVASLVVALACGAGPAANAQPQDPGVASAFYLFKQATTPQRDGSHNAMLLGLRQLEDPALSPLFRGLGDSPYLSMRIHGRLGRAAFSPQRRIDLARLAEIEDQRELVQVLAAAIDDDLIDNAGMATLQNWPGLDLSLRQAVALRLMGAGGEVDTKPFRASLEVELNDELGVGKLLQYALAAIMLAEADDDAGKAALDTLANLRGDAAKAVLAQALDAAMRHGFTSAGPLGLALANDVQRDPALRLLAVQTAMRLKTPGASKAWQAMLEGTDDSAPRIRLAMIALDAAEQVDPALFDVLKGDGAWAGMIAQAGRALANEQDNLAKHFEPLIATGQPLSVQWVATYCRRSEPAQGPALLGLVIDHHNAGPSHHRGRITQAAIDAATTLCEVYPEQATQQLSQRFAASLRSTEPDALAQRQIILMGIAQVQSDQLKPLAQALEPDPHNDFTTDALRLFIRARHGVPLTDQEWQRVSDIVQGVGQLTPTMRLQFAWAYLKHKGMGNPGIAQALR